LRGHLRSRCHDKDESFAERYIQHGNAQSLQQVKYLLDTNSEVLTAEMRAELIAERALYETDKSLDKKKILKPWQIAKVAEMTDVYLSTYALFSIKVHPSTRSLIGHLVKGDDGTITHIRFGPTHEDSKLVLRQNMHLMTRCLGAMGNLFQFDTSANLNSFFERMHDIDQDSERT
jgi:hypothetical protein